MSRVFMGIPHVGSMAPEVLDSLAQPPTVGEHEILIRHSGISLLAMNFNGLLCSALNQTPACDYFLLHHNDIGIGPDACGWLDYMIEQIQEHKAAALSLVVPIKDGRGMTSTGLLKRTHGKREHRRIVVKELDGLPDTFDVKDVAKLFDAETPEDCLMTVNTGVLLLDLKQIRPHIEKLCFTIRDKITIREDGLAAVHVWPEDWNFSEAAHDLGLHVIANKNVPLTHKGNLGFMTGARWGQDHDGWAEQGA